MKRLLTLVLPVAALAFFGASAALAYVSPGNPTGYVNDYANLLTSIEKSSLESKLTALQNDTGAEVAVVTIPTLDGDTIENYAVKLFQEWKIGKEKQDNGLLLLIALEEREVRIEVGYGLEPVITDADAFRIIQENIVPNFKERKYVDGIVEAVDHITALIRVEHADTPAPENKSPINEFLWPFIFILGIQLFPVMVYTKSWWLGGVLGFLAGLVIFSSLFSGIIVGAIGLVADYFLSKLFARKLPSGHDRGPWFGGMGGHGGFGGSGGGFGGFGGGSSGGGGASGRW